MQRGQVEIHTLAVDAIAPADWPLLERLLPDVERARAARFHFDRDRHVYIAGHALLRARLSHHLSGPPSGWRFTAGPHGKPEVVLPPDQPKLRVNLSHTRGLAAVAVTVDDDLGVDVEWVERDSRLLDIADRYFAPAEIRQLEAAPDAAKRDTFFAFWTLKEAYIKAIGLGLAMPLHDFAFTLEPLSVAFASHVADVPADWSFRRFQPAPGHAMAMAVRHAAPRIDVHTADLRALRALVTQ